MTPDYTAKLHRGAFDWIHRCYSIGTAHGSQLVEAIAGIGNNTRVADEILEVWLKAGWITQHENPSPTHDQLFLGVGGRPPGKRPSKATAHPIEFGYSANYESQSLLEFVREHSVVYGSQHAT